MTEPLDTAEQQGRTAWRNGLATSQCPYPPEQIVLRHDWLRGWVSEERGFSVKWKKVASV